MSRHLFRCVAAVAAVAALATSPARADVILTFEATSPGLGLDMMASYVPYLPMPAGAMQFGVGAGGPENGIPGPTLQTFCAQIFTDVGHGIPVSYSVVPVTQLADVQAPPSGNTDPAGKAAYLTELFGRYYDQTGTDLGAAAFQYAVWEILYDPLSDLNVNSGYVHLIDNPERPQPAGPLAQGWLDSLSGDTTQFTANPEYAGKELVGFASPSYQEQIGIRQDPDTVTTPAPPALVLVLLGGLAVGGRAWSGRRKAAV